MMVPSHYQQAVPRTQKLHHNDKRGSPVQRTQAHLKPYHIQDKKVENELVSQNNHMWTVKMLNSKQNTDNLAQSRPKRDIKPLIKLDL